MPPWSKTLGRTKSPTFNGAMVWNAGSCSLAAAAQHGRRVLYREAHALVDEFADAQLAGTRKPYLAQVTTVPLLVLDDLGMKRLPPTAAEDLLEIVNARGAEPRVEVEAHRGPPPVRGPERLRANRAQRFETLERALNDSALRQAGPLLAVHLARGERARQPATGEPGRQQGGRHRRRVGDGRIEPAGVGGQPPGTMEDGEP